MITAQASFEWMWEIIPSLAVVLVFLKGFQVMGEEALHDARVFLRKHHKGMLVLTAAVVMLAALVLSKIYY